MTSHNNSESGFTMLEMIVVIAVMGLVLGMVTLFGPPHDRGLEMQVAARQVAGAMRDAHGQAIAHDQPVPFIMPKLPAWLSVSVQAPPGGILFEPDGSASGGQVLLAGAGRKIAVTADWLTGGVKIDAQ